MKKWQLKLNENLLIYNQGKNTHNGKKICAVLIRVKKCITHLIIIKIIIIIIIIINCNWVITRWQWLFYMYTNMEKKVTRKFKSGGLHERHVVAT